MFFKTICIQLLQSVLVSDSGHIKIIILSVVTSSERMLIYFAFYTAVVPILVIMATNASVGGETISFSQHRGLQSMENIVWKWTST